MTVGGNYNYNNVWCGSSLLKHRKGEIKIPTKEKDKKKDKEKDQRKTIQRKRSETHPKIQRNQSWQSKILKNFLLNKR